MSDAEMTAGEEILQPGFYWMRYRARPVGRDDPIDRAWKWTVAQVADNGRWHPLRGVPGRDGGAPPEWEVIGDRLEPPHG